MRATPILLAAILVPACVAAPLATAATIAAAGLPTLAAAARSILGADQGVYVEASDGTALLAQAAARPVHPASVSKVPTTLALLRKFGPDYRFTTTFSGNGPVEGGTLSGNLLVSSDGDPNFVDENALLVAARLNQLGIRRVSGALQPLSALTFDWQDDSDAVHLRLALSGSAPAAAWGALRDLNTTAPATGPMPAIQFLDHAAASPAPPRPLVIHHSQPLLALAKALNDYSNNIFKPLAEAAGGAAAVEALARSVVPADMRREITLGDGAGTDPRNRLSPRAAVKLLRALERELTASGHALVDILPVAGVDAGTLQKRLSAPDEAGRVVGKTGTFGDYGASALIGAIATSDRGTIYFAILNHGVPVPEARRRQDRFLHVLLGRLRAVPWNYRRDALPAVARAEALVADGGDALSARFAPVTLHPHPARPMGPVRGLTACGGISPDGRLELEFALQGDLQALRVEKPAGRPRRRDELWRHTCFECFAAAGADPRYLELNFSTSGDWAAYAFAGYRERRMDLGTAVVSIAAQTLGSDGLKVSVEAGLDDAFVPGTDPRAGADWRLNLAAVIEDVDGTLSYWAVHHPRPEPDFHDRAGFRVALQAAS